MKLLTKYPMYKPFILALTLLVSFPVLADPPNVVGVFSGTLTGDKDGCFTTVSPTSNNVTLDITSQTGNAFTGTFTVSGLTDGGNVNGTVTDAGLVSGTFSGANILGFGFSGTFTGTSLIIAPISLVVEDLSMNCFDLGGTLNFVAAPMTDEEGINPEESAGTELKDSSGLRTDVNTVEQPVHTHLRKTMHGDAKGGNLNESGFLIEGEGGLNAGDWQLGNLGLWLSYNYTESEDDFFRTAFESDRHTVVGGVDFSPTDNTVLGVAIAYEDSDTDTTFNSGELESDGFTIAPYLGVLLSDTWSLDASFGLSFIENEQFRTDPTTAARITSDPDTDRFYISANLNGVTFIDNWVLGGRVGYLFARSSTEDFTESDGTVVSERSTKLGQFRIGGDAGYSYGHWEPFVSALYEYDFSFDEVRLTAGAQPENDRDDILFAVGTRYFNGNWSGNFEYSKRLFRDDFDEDSWTATLRYDF